MAEQSVEPPVNSAVSDAPETLRLLLETYAEFYRQELGAEEDVHRTLPFFGTALGIVIGALAYAAGRLPRWNDTTTLGASVGFILASILLGLAVAEAICVLFWLARAIARRDYVRIGPEAALRARLAELQVYYENRRVFGPERDAALSRDIRHVLLDSYAEVTPRNRRLNLLRYGFRAKASSHLVRSLIWAVGATTVIFVVDKLGYLPKVSL